MTSRFPPRSPFMQPPSTPAAFGGPSTAPTHRSPSSRGGSGISNRPRSPQSSSSSSSSPATAGATALATPSHDDRPIRARGFYDASVFVGRNDHDRGRLIRRADGDTAGGSAALAAYVAAYASDAVSDADFSRAWPYERLLELDAAVAPRGGLAPSQLAALLPPRRGLAVPCSICLETTRLDEKVVVLPACGHSFHGHCVQAWFVMRATCPLCRASVVPEPPTEGDAPTSTTTAGGAGAVGPDR